MARNWNEIVKLPEWQTHLGKLAFVLGVEDDGSFEIELRRAYPGCFKNGEDEGRIPWTAIEVENVYITEDPSPRHISTEVLDYLSIEYSMFALTSEAAIENGVPQVPPGRYAVRDEFEHQGVVYFVVCDETVDNDGTIYAIKKTDINWDA